MRPGQGGGEGERKEGGRREGGGEGRDPVRTLLLVCLLQF